jgi:hypothetical protein
MRSGERLAVCVQQPSGFTAPSATPHEHPPAGHCRALCCHTHSCNTQHCAEDIAFFDAMVEKGLQQRLQDVLDKPFATGVCVGCGGWGVLSSGAMPQLACCAA